MKKHTWYELFQGELTDAPGRCESWTDELCYLGNEEWLWREQGTDFTGLEKHTTMPCILSKEKT